MNIVWLVGLGAASLLLVRSGVMHLRQLGRFRINLVEQQVLPIVAVPIASSIFLALEITVGLAGVAAVGLAAPVSRIGLVVGAALVAATYAVIASYLVVQLTVAPGARCACFGEAVPTTWRTVIRAVALLAAAGLAAVADPTAGFRTGLAILALSLLVAALLRRIGDTSPTAAAP